MSTDRKTVKKAVKGNVIAFIIYPDNRDQLEFLQYLTEREKVIYILHKAEGERSIMLLRTLQLHDFADDMLGEVHDFKDHIHCMICFNNPRYASGFVKSSCGVLSHAEVVSDRLSYGQYMIHNTFACLKAHKTEYTLQDVRCSDLGRDFYSSVFYPDNSESSFLLVNDILQYVEISSSFADLQSILVDNQRADLIKFSVSHSYYVQMLGKAHWNSGRYTGNDY